MMVRTSTGLGDMLQRICTSCLQILHDITNGSSINHGLMIIFKIYESQKASLTAIVTGSETN
jgi:hypothetical protein